MDKYVEFDRKLPIPVGSIDLQKEAGRLCIRYFLPSMSSLHLGTRAPLVPKSAIRKVQTDGFNMHGFSDFNYTGDEPECYVVPDPATLIQCPWDTEIGWLSCFLYHKNQPSEQCPRRTLIKHLNIMKERGYLMKCGTELEFTMLHTHPDRDETTNSYQDPIIQLKHKGFCAKLLDALDQLGWGPYQLEHEFNPNQYEINYGYTDPLTCADRLQFLKFMVKSIAAQEHLTITFMPQPFKPKAHYFGNGLHVHLSLWDMEDRSLMTDEAGFLGLSDVGRHFMNGILTHLSALTAIACPTVNSYKRLYINKNVTYLTAYGLNTRFPPIRIVQERNVSNRIEVRLPDPSINPYLLLSALLVAGLDGLTKGTDPDQALNLSDLDLWDRDTPDHLVKLPRTLAHALAALRKDTVLMGNLGDDIVKAFLCKKDAHVEESLWELSHYELSLVNSY